MEEETEILKSIYPDDIVKCDVDCDNPIFEMTIYPSDTDNEQSKKPLRLNLVAIFSKSYPNETPEFKFKNVRGITDEDLKRIHNEINQIAKRNLGSQILFEIIQHLKDQLTCYGAPKTSGCSICLNDFDESEKITNLECCHYFHTVCLLKHIIYIETDIETEKKEAVNNRIKWKERRVGCPVCRENLSFKELDELHALKYEKNILLNANEERFSPEIVSISKKMRELQIEMKTLFEKQKKAGGIIDLNENEIIILTDPLPLTTAETDTHECIFIP